MRRAVPVLMYHQVSRATGPIFRKYTVTPRAFAAQMRYLKLAGYKTISLSSLVSCGAAGVSLPARPVVITFDDGYADCAQHTLRALQARDFTATYFLVAGLVGQTARWLGAEHGASLRLFDWDVARELEAAGMSCGSHTLSHPHLAEVAPEECRRELVQSRAMLEEQLGRPVLELAYPFGSYNDAVRAIAAETGYTAACSVRIGLSGPGDDPLALSRVPVTGQDTLLDFACRLRTGWPLKPLLRGRLARARSSLARSAPREVRP